MIGTVPYRTFLITKETVVPSTQSLLLGSFRVLQEDEARWNHRLGSKVRQMVPCGQMRRHVLFWTPVSWPRSFDVDSRLRDCLSFLPVRLVSQPKFVLDSAAFLLVFRLWVFRAEIIIMTTTTTTTRMAMMENTY